MKPATTEKLLIDLVAEVQKLEVALIALLNELRSGRTEVTLVIKATGKRRRRRTRPTPNGPPAF